MLGSLLLSRLTPRHTRRDAVPPAARRYLHSADMFIRRGDTAEAGVLLRAAARELDARGSR